MQTTAKAEKTRQFIIEKTASIFNEKGFAGTSFNDLTSATGLSKGCIYGHFDSKDEIALAAFDYNRQRMTEYFQSQMKNRINSVDQLLVYPEVILRFPTIPAWQGGCPILNTSTEADDTHANLKKRASDAFSNWQEQIQNQIRRGIDRKEIKVDADASELAVLIVYMIEGAVMQAKVSGKMDNVKIAMEFLKKIIEDLRA